MKTLIIYDSNYGNTAHIAEAMADALRSEGEVTLQPVVGAIIEQVDAHDCLIFGSPSQGGRPTRLMQRFLDNLPSRTFHDKRIAVFDTRFDEHTHGLGLRLLMNTIGYAADKMAKNLRGRGAYLELSPIGFIVEDTEGPLKAGELQRAASWAKALQLSPA